MSFTRKQHVSFFFNSRKHFYNFKHIICKYSDHASMRKMQKSTNWLLTKSDYVISISRFCMRLHTSMQRVQKSTNWLLTKSDYVISIEILYEISYFDAKTAEIDELTSIKIRLRHIFIEIAFDVPDEILLVLHMTSLLYLTMRRNWSS